MLITFFSFASGDHFEPAYLSYTQNPPPGAMNISVMGAILDEAELDSLDEIGVFDGDICVGAGVWTGSELSIITTADDPTTGEIDGFINEHLMSFRIWDASDNNEIDNVVAEELFENSQLIEMNQPLLMTASLAIFDKGEGDRQVVMSPILFAAWLGFLITFLNLLPAWQLDGGHMARALFGKKWHQIATYASMGVLVALGYWFMALFILVLSNRSQDAKPLDDISPLSKNRKKMFVVIAILGFLCAPLPPGILP